MSRRRTEFLKDQIKKNLWQFVKKPLLACYIIVVCPQVQWVKEFLVVDWELQFAISFSFLHFQFMWVPNSLKVLEKSCLQSTRKSPSPTSQGSKKRLKGKLNSCKQRAWRRKLTSEGWKLNPQKIDSLSSCDKAI